MGLLSTLVLSSALAFFGGEVREASAKAGIGTPVVEWGDALPHNPAWVVFPCDAEFLRWPDLYPECRERNPITTIYLHKSQARQSQWQLTLWAYHEVCHVRLGHRWPIGYTEEEMARDHREVRDCQIDLLGKARYNVLRRIIYGNAYSSVPVRPAPPVFGGLR